MSQKPKPSNESRTLEEKQRDNRANQLNPNNERFWKARRLDKPPRPEPPHRKISK